MWQTPTPYSPYSPGSLLSLFLFPSCFLLFLFYKSLLFCLSLKSLTSTTVSCPLHVDVDTHSMGSGQLSMTAGANLRESAGADCACVCLHAWVSLWLCVFVCVIVCSNMKSVVPCSLHTVCYKSFVSHSWTPDKVLHHLVTVKFPSLDLVSVLPALPVILLQTDVCLCAFIFPRGLSDLECETTIFGTIDCLHVYSHAVPREPHDFLFLVVSRETSSS